MAERRVGQNQPPEGRLLIKREGHPTQAGPSKGNGMVQAV